jgi:hypothetical protein
VYLVSLLSSFISSISWSVGSCGFSKNTTISVFWWWGSIHLRVDFQWAFQFCSYSWSVPVFNSLPNVNNLCFIPQGVCSLSFQIVCSGICNSHWKCLKCPCIFWILMITSDLFFAPGCQQLIYVIVSLNQSFCFCYLSSQFYFTVLPYYYKFCYWFNKHLLGIFSVTDIALDAGDKGGCRLWNIASSHGKYSPF